MNTRDYFYKLKTTRIMKTGSTMNFLKRAGAILMVVAIFASSCNKYADDFDQLNKKIDALASTIAGVPQLSTDLAAVKASIASIQTAVAALPTATQNTASFKAVTDQLTAMTTQVNAITATLATVVTSGTATKAVVDKLTLDLAALSTKVAADNATMIKGQADAMTKLNAMDVKVDGLATKLTTMQASMVALADAVTKVQAGVDANKLDIAGLAGKLTDQAAAIKQIGLDLAANTAANVIESQNVAAILADVSASGLIMAGQANLANQISAIQTAIAADAKTGTATDTATSLTIQGLQLQLNAMNVTLQTIWANTVKSVSTPTITGNILVGGILTAAPGTAPETGTWQWSNCATVGGTYVAIAGATASTYTVQAGDVTKFIKVTITGTGSWAGASITTPATATSLATGAILANIPLTPFTAGITGTLQVGQTLTAPVVNPVSLVYPVTATYQWMSAASATGVYSPIAGATKSTYKTVTADATMYLQVVATGVQGYSGVVTSANVGPIAYTDINTPAFTLVSANNTITVTLTDGSFSATVAKGNFNFVGLDAATLNGGGVIFTRVSSTKVTFTTVSATGFGLMSSNYVAISNAGMATQSTAAVAVPSTEVIIVPVGLAISGVIVPVQGVAPVVTAPTLTGGTATISWSPSPVANFLPGIVYTANITVTPDASHTLTGVAANSFTVGGATTVTNTINSGAVAAVFPVTATIPVTISAILGVTPPVTGAVGATTITANAQYTGTITWSPGLIAGKFQSGQIYTAVVAIVPNLGYSVTGVAANFFTIAGGSGIATNPAGTGNSTVAFAATL